MKLWPLLRSRSTLLLFSIQSHKIYKILRWFQVNSKIWFSEEALSLKFLVIKRSLLISILRSVDTILSWIVWDTSVQHGFEGNVTKLLVNFIAQNYGVDAIPLIILFDILLPFITFYFLYRVMDKLNIKEDHQKLTSRAVALLLYIPVVVGLTSSLMTLLEFNM